MSWMPDIARTGALSWTRLLSFLAPPAPSCPVEPEPGGTRDVQCLSFDGRDRLRQAAQEGLPLREPTPPVVLPRPPAALAPSPPSAEVPPARSTTLVPAYSATEIATARPATPIATFCAPSLLPASPASSSPAIPPASPSSAPVVPAPSGELVQAPSDPPSEAAWMVAPSLGLMQPMALKVGGSATRG